MSTEDEFAWLFKVQASERPKLFDPKTMKLLAKLKAGDPQRYEELLEAWKGNKLSGVAKIDAEVEKIVKRGRKAKGGDGDGPGAVLRRIIDSAELWHDQYREPYATVTVTAKDESVHREHLAVGGQAFRLWVQHEFWRATKSVPKKELLNGWVDTARGQGLFDGEEHRTYVRVAALADRVYVDLTDAAWQAVEIDKTGWRIITDPPVRFRRAGGEQPLPTPVRSTSDIEDMLGTLVKVRRPEQLKLVLGHMVACLGLDGPIPMLCFVCEYGSLKTSTMRVVRTHVDPRTPMTSGLSKSEDDMLVAGKAQWLLAFDNLSEIPDDMADVLCRVVTGGGSYKRKLFTDADLSALDIRRPVLLTATQMPSNRPDFIDRTIAIDLIQVDKAARLTERKAKSTLEALKPALMAKLLDGVSCALRRYDATEARLAGKMERMSDFCVWSESAAEAFGWQDGEFLESYSAMLKERRMAAVEDDQFCGLAVSWMLHNGHAVFEAPASLWLKELAVRQDDGKPVEHERWYPKTPKAMANKLSSMRQSLAAVGVAYSVVERPGRGPLHKLEIVDEEAARAGGLRGGDVF